jgi:hypothetical protein
MRPSSVCEVHTLCLQFVKLLLYADFGYFLMRPYATSACGLKLLVHAALRPSVCGLNLLVFAALSY